MYEAGVDESKVLPECPLEPQRAFCLETARRYMLALAIIVLNINQI